MILSHTHSASPRIVVAGGGIAGAEAALTLAKGLPDAKVRLVGKWPDICILPGLIYVPFGVSPHRLIVPMAELEEHGVSSTVAHVEAVGVEEGKLITSQGDIQFDVLVAAPGARAKAHEECGLRNLDDAVRIRHQLAHLLSRARQGQKGTITIRAEAEDSWTAPACELAMLIGRWVQRHELAHRVEILLATADHDAFEWFGPVGEAIVEASLRRAGVKVATGVPAGRFDELGGDMVVEFGQLEARSIRGLPGYKPHGWYEPDANFQVARHVHVIGDAVHLPYRAGFASAWQARRVLTALGGDVSDLPTGRQAIPINSVEYQMDLADSVMRARVDRADILAHPFLGHDAEVRMIPGGRPDKLMGLLLHDLILRRHRRKQQDGPLIYRKALLAH